MIFLSEVPTDEINRALAQASTYDPKTHPLCGLRVAVKDNIDVADWPTTAACPDYKRFATETNPAVQHLFDAGAVFVGKTNLDQFATGLVGTRSPYGIPENPFHKDFIPGGSSSGSASAVSCGHADIGIGTDTAGSGRVPAAMQNLVGWKPTRGLLSTRGVIPACRSLDCVSVFAKSVREVADVMPIMARFDEHDPQARPMPSVLPYAWVPSATVLGVPMPQQREFCGDNEASALFDSALARWRALGVEIVEIDFSPFLNAAKLLYEGPWVAERYAVLEDLLESAPDSILPVTREIVSQGAKPRAVEAFRASYQLARLKRAADTILSSVDAIVTPTIPTAFRISEVLADPIRLNSKLGTYTNFMNLLDCAAIAVPSGFYAGADKSGLPFGITIFAPAFHDHKLIELAAQYHHASGLQTGLGGPPAPPWTAPPSWPTYGIDVAVCGAHMRGLALHGQLASRGARFVRKAQTAACYHFHALPPGPGVPARPGLVFGGNSSVELEIWRVPSAEFGSFVAAIPPPLGIGKILLDDDQRVTGFLCESHAIVGTPDIGALGSWRVYLTTQHA